MGKNWIHFNRRTCFVLLTVFLTEISSTVGCGWYIEIENIAETGTIYSPAYPSNYGNSRLCIWFIRAPKNYAVVLSIPGMSGQVDATSGDCLDYLEVRNGSSTQTIEYKECDSTTPATIESYSRWLWVKFKSDDTVTNTGFTADYSVVSSPGNSEDGNPVPDCSSVQHRCPNKECISWAYKCDGAEDCGCSIDDCDEIGCGPLGWSTTGRMFGGIGIGTGVFCLVFFGIGILDIYLKKRAIRKYKEETEQRKKMAKQRRVKAAVESMFTTESKLDVPGSRSISRQSSWSINKSPGEKTPTCTTPTSLTGPQPAAVAVKIN